MKSQINLTIWINSNTFNIDHFCQKFSYVAKVFIILKYHHDAPEKHSGEKS